MGWPVTGSCDWLLQGSLLLLHLELECCCQAASVALQLVTERIKVATVQSKPQHCLFSENKRWLDVLGGLEKWLG